MGFLELDQSKVFFVRVPGKEIPGKLPLIGGIKRGHLYLHNFL